MPIIVLYIGTQSKKGNHIAAQVFHSEVNKHGGDKSVQLTIHNNIRCVEGTKSEGSFNIFTSPKDFFRYKHYHIKSYKIVSNKGRPSTGWLSISVFHKDDYSTLKR